MNDNSLLKPFSTIISRFRKDKVSIANKDIHFYLSFVFREQPTYNDYFRTLYNTLKPFMKDSDYTKTIEWNGMRYNYTININHEVIEHLKYLYSETNARDDTASNVGNAELLKSLKIMNAGINIDITDDIDTDTINATITNKHKLRHILMDAYFLLRHIESSVIESEYIKIKESFKYIILTVNGIGNNYRPIACIRNKGISIMEQYDTNKEQWNVIMLVKDSKDVDTIIDCLFR